MKKFFYYTICMSIAMLLYSCSNDDNIDDTDDIDNSEYYSLIKDIVEPMNMPRPDGSYNYPVYPGMNEWANIKSWEEIEVPEKILKQQSTQAVIQAIWEYPLFINFLSRYMYQGDFDVTIGNTNAYKELILRDDAGKCLLERFILVEPAIQKIDYMPRDLEFILSQDYFLKQLGLNDKITIVKTALEKEKLRDEMEFNPNLVRELTFILIGRTMVSAGYEPFITETLIDDDLAFFLKGDQVMTYRSYIKTVADYAKSFIESHQ